MKAYAHLLMQPVHARRRQGSLWLTWTLLALAPAMLALAALADALPLGLVVCAGLVAATAFMWWGWFLASALRQHLPSNACLVPGLHRRVVRLTVFVWLAASVLLAALLALGAGHFGYFLVGVGAILLFVLAQQRLTWLGVVPAVSFFAASAVLNNPVGQLFALVRRCDELAFALIGMALLCAAGVWMVRAVFSAGGDRLYARVAVLENKHKAVDQGLLSPIGEAMPRWHSLLPFGYVPSLARDCGAGAGSISPRAGRLLMYGLGPHAHWAGHVLMALGLFLCVALLAAWCAYSGRALPLVLVRTQLQLLAMLPVALMVPGMVGAMQRSAAEQSLLRLTPAAPRTVDLNRALAQAMLARFALVWAASAAAAVGGGMVLAGSFALEGLAVAIPVLFLPFGALLLLDYAALPWKTNSTLISGLVVGASVVAFGVMGVPDLSLLLPWGWCAVAYAAASAVLLRWRWRRMAAAAPAFPAGRLA